MSPSYGTVNGDSSQTVTGDHESFEDSHLLGKPGRKSFSSRLHRHMTADVDRAWADLILLFGYTITGLLDSSAVFIWGAFVSMQTGNSIYLGLGLVDPQDSSRWILSLTSIASFCLGSFCFSTYHRYFGPKRRWVLVVSFAIQAVFVVAAGVIVKLDQSDGNKLHWHVVLPLVLVAFQASGQAVTSRALKYNSMTSVVLTSIYADLFGDADLFVGITQNAERNRRAAAPLLLLVGAVLGGFWSHSSVGLSGALWMAAAMKGVVVLVWLFWKKDPKPDEDD